MKKFLAILLALTFMLSLGVCAFADEGQEIDAEAGASEAAAAAAADGANADDVNADNADADNADADNVNNDNVNADNANADNADADNANADNVNNDNANDNDTAPGDDEPSESGPITGQPGNTESPAPGDEGPGDGGEGDYEEYKPPVYDGKDVTVKRDEDMPALDVDVNDIKDNIKVVVYGYIELTSDQYTVNPDGSITVKKEALKDLPAGTYNIDAYAEGEDFYYSLGWYSMTIEAEAQQNNQQNNQQGGKGGPTAPPTGENSSVAVSAAVAILALTGACACVFKKEHA